MNIEKIYQLLKKKYNCEFVITGGDSVSDHCLDYLEVDGKIQVFKSKKKSTNSTHGSGCIFSSALTIFLAKGYSLIESLKKSKKFINKQIERLTKIKCKIWTFNLKLGFNVNFTSRVFEFFGHFFFTFFTSFPDFL